ncbi:hypothetical protein EDB19DRAFT_1649717 [Suillus lakei]|nr:hypothetical protein EDB19DRAFT_1649717 [Suillus lakei]
MEETRGLGRGSYIWGRSVHNVRIERLWCDLTSGFGAKWKDFFQSLEAHDGLNTDLDSHTWLLHHLFLDAINKDALEWAEAWNNHVMSIRGDQHSSPRDMFFFGMLENGVRGFDGAEDDEAIDDPASYGIDWASIDDRRIIGHHHAHNEEDELGDNPFVTHRPHQFSEVVVPEADSPLSLEQLQFLDTQLEALAPVYSHSMDSRRLIWSMALDMCRNFFAQENSVL